MSESHVYTVRYSAAAAAWFVEGPLARGPYGNGLVRFTRRGALWTAKRLSKKRPKPTRYEIREGKVTAS